MASKITLKNDINTEFSIIHNDGSKAKTISTNDMVQVVNTIADMVAIQNCEDGQTVIVRDVNRGGTFIWSATGIANGGTVFAGLTGYWVRQYSGALSIKWFGYTKVGNKYTINVPSDFATINLAMEFVYSLSIAEDEFVEIKVADGTYTITSSISLNHPIGTNIRLVGNETTPSNCVLQVIGEPTFNLLVCNNGNTFGYLNGFRINATTKATLAHNFSGVIAYNGATIICGNKIEVNNFYYGINASYNSTIIADYAKVSNGGDVNIWAFCGSFVSAKYAVSNNASDTVNGWGFGFQAEYGSNINIEGAEAYGCNIAGIASLSNSQVRALNTSTHNNIGSGYFSNVGGQIEAYGGSSTNNGRYGLEIINPLGDIVGLVTNTGNTLGTANKFVYMDNTLGQVTVTSGDLRLDAAANSHYFYGAGGLGFSIYTPTSTVNRLQVNGASTLNAPSITAVGNDAVIDLALFPKGAGSYVQIGAGYVATAGTITGYIPVKDNTGTVRKLAVIT